MLQVPCGFTKLRCGWTDAGVKELKRQCRGIAKLYEKMILEEKKFYFSPFETKLSTHIRGEDALCNRCLFGKKQVSMGHDGAIYPCINYLFSHFPIE